MTAPRLRSPEGVRSLLARRYAAKHRQWLGEQGAWPMVVSLGVPSEKDAQQHPDAVRAWVAAWQQWRGPGILTWHERQWPAMGAQRLPKSLTLAHAGEVAEWLGEAARWRRAQARFVHLTGRWPALCESLPRHFDVLADYDETELGRLESLLAWLEEHPASNLYPRQLPVPGVDGKWLERRKGLIAGLLAALRRDDAGGADLFTYCGLRPIPRLIRLRILDARLRERVGGLSDISAPVEEIAGLDLPILGAFIVENVQTGLAFGELPGAVVFMGLGYGVEVLGQIPWLSGRPCLYWGDLDTHGFAILSHARTFQPHIASCLMDEATLIQHKALWGEERQQHAASELPALTEAEQDVYRGLKKHRWGLNIRLEQERIDWATAWREICAKHERFQGAQPSR